MGGRFGILLLSVFYVVSGFVCTVIGALSLYIAVDVGMFLVTTSNAMSFFFMVYGLLLLLIGWGLWNFRTWAWLLALITGIGTLAAALVYSELLIAFMYAVVVVYLLAQHELFSGVRPEVPALPKTPVMTMSVEDTEEKTRFVKRKRKRRPFVYLSI